MEDDNYGGVYVLRTMYVPYTYMQYSLKVYINKSWKNKRIIVKKVTKISDKSVKIIGEFALLVFLIKIY